MILASIDNEEYILSSPYSNLVWDKEWPKILARQRHEGSMFIKAKSIQVRFELGLPFK